MTMKIAYIILTHRYPEQLIRLIDRLDTEKSTFLIHIDKKVDLKSFDLVYNQLQIRPNVHFIKRYTCHWASFGIVQATFQGIKEAIEKKLEFDYLSLISGQDYPIKSNKYIFNFFRKHNGKSFMHLNSFPFSYWKDQNDGWDRVKFWHIIRKEIQFPFAKNSMPFTSKLANLLWNILNKFVPIYKIRRKFPIGFHPYGGCQFWFLYKDHALYIYDFIIKKPSFFKFFRFVLVPDEIVFQTIIGNSKLTPNVVPDSMHFLKWTEAGEAETLTQSDFNSLKNSNCLFARKFDCNLDPEILSLIDKEILFPGDKSAFPSVIL